MNRRAFAKFAAGSGAIGLVGDQTAFAEATATPGVATNSRLFGNAHDLIPTGTGEGIEIVTVGGFIVDGISQGSARIILRNNTDKTVFIDDIESAARDHQGKLMMVSESLSFLVPVKVEVGDIAIASMSFGLVEAFDPDWEYEVEVSYSESEGRRVDLEITEVALNKGLDGFIQNSTDTDVEGYIEIFALFFNEDGSIQGYAWERMLEPPLASGERTPFKAKYSGVLGEMTDRFLVGANGRKAR